jgi:hypothetical protein
LWRHSGRGPCLLPEFRRAQHFHKRYAMRWNQTPL